MQCSGWPVERYEVLIKAGKILSYHAGVPRTLSSGWFAGFVRRHHDLTTRVAQQLSHARNSVTKEGVMKCFFDLVKGCIGFACTASDVYNVDETSFKTKGSTKKAMNTTTLPRQTAIQVAGEAFNAVFPAVGVEKRNKAVENGFRTCGIWPLSLPKMLNRLALAQVNSVRSASAAWLKTKEHVREEVLTLPPQKKGINERKRVSTNLEWYTREELHASAVRPVKQKK
ncbi:hypothetical protein DYB34_007758 [Aphanomyces astaci]|uniref:HTH CENPB-type domain-containing protein n=1 Tax=Aphanomyces astaci TaxID=112090 RepID=A0A418C5E7_APHAT|nr:hypothetical protein DYB34_007758 [Aphanomyces astaci]